MKSRSLEVAVRALLSVGTLGVACGAETGNGASLAPLALDVSARARAVAPGEPLRIVVSSLEALASLEAKFGQRDVFMARRGGGPVGARETWLGWSMVPLDGAAGIATIDVRGRTASGRPAHGVLAIEIAPRDFPAEQLSVAAKYVTPSAEATARLEEERARLRAIYVSRRLPLAAGPFVAPVPGTATSIFGTRRILNGEPRDPHPGLDLRAAEGETVVASGSGEIVLARDLYYSGNTVIVDHGGGLFTLYAHLSRIDVAEGTPIGRGAPLGLSGSTGRVTGPHLHWGAKIGDAPFDPRALFDPALFP